MKKPLYRVPSMKQIRAIKPNGLTVATTFAGAGGSSLGYRMAGFRVVWANEFVPIAQESYRANAMPYTVVDGRDVKEVTAEDILKATGLARGELDVFDGSPPCQAFSTAGKREDGWGTDKHYEHGASQKNEQLFDEYIRLRDGLMPRVFVAENVSGLVKGTAKGFFLQILKKLRVGYRVVCPLLDAQWLGVPQARQRVVFIGVRDDLGFDPPVPAPLPWRYSVREAIPWIDRVDHDTMGSFKSGGRITDRPSVTIMSSPRDATHFKVVQNSNATHSRKGERRSLDDPAPTLLARRSNLDLQRVTETRRVMNKDVVSDNVGATMEGYAIGKEWDKLNPGQQSEKFFSLVRPDADQPCPTITASGAGATASGAPGGVASVTHPTEKRKFTILEVKRLCSFPDDVDLKGTYGQQWERLGNSVPPLMMKAVAVEIRDRVLLPARDAAKTGARPPRSSGHSTKVKPPKGAGRTPA